MSHRFLLFLVFCAILATGCHPSTVKITGRFIGSDCHVLYLEQVTSSAPLIVDSAVLDADGTYRFELKRADRVPSLYELVCNGDRIPLFLAAGDRLTVDAVGHAVNNYTVSGSEESELLRQFYQPFVEGLTLLDRLASSVDEDMTEYRKTYLATKQAQLRFIASHPASLAAVYALYQRLPGETWLINPGGDLIYYRMVAGELAKSYPESSYLPLLASDIARLDTQANLESGIAEMNFPDIEMGDMYGGKVRLSSLLGKVILVDFWSAGERIGNVNNAELKKVYAQYADRGFEVYQIGVDTSKSAWVEGVQEQRLPWISVSDFRGAASPVLGQYNVQTLPTNFLIDREGVVVARDLYGAALEQALRVQFQE